jgi:hypothetical protein
MGERGQGEEGAIAQREQERSVNTTIANQYPYRSILKQGWVARARMNDCTPIVFLSPYSLFVRVYLTLWQ